MPLVLPGEEVSLNEPGRRFARHHHLKAYAALIVSGSCDEAGDRGRFRANAGDVLVHLAFEAHQDRIGPRGAKIINFEIDDPAAGAFGHVADLDAIVRLHESDPVAAGELLGEQFAPHSKADTDWPDLLAEELTRAEPARLDRWAELHGLNPSSLSRGFRLAYGVSPKRFRLEQMVSRAARSARESGEGLSMVAAASGFADQSHMTRAMAELFGVTPGRLRRLS
ncbi:MAG TPA: helix-turn-helix transcriptional regulator [Sphingomicrobium sp.]